MSASDRILTNNNYHDVSKAVLAHDSELQIDIKPVLKNKRRRSNRSANSENTADDSDGKNF